MDSGDPRDAPRADWDGLVATLAAEPAGAFLSAPGTAVAIWDVPDGEPAWSRGGFPGLVGPAPRLPAGLSPAFRLARLRLGGGALQPPATVAWRRVVPEGRAQPVLVAAILGAAALHPRAAVSGPPEPTVPESGPLRTDELLVAAPLREPRRGRRIVWRMGPDGRFASLAPDPAVVGSSGAADVVGRRWDEIVGRLVLDPEDAVAEALRTGKAWTRHPVTWRGLAPEAAIPAEMSGSPASGHEPSGWRGYLVLFPDEAGAAAPGTFAAPLTPAEPLPADREAGPTPTPSPPPAPIVPALGEAFEAAAALTGTAGDSMFGVLKAWLGPASAGLWPPLGEGARAASHPPRPGATDLPTSDPAPLDGEAAAGLTGLERGALHEIARALGASVEEPPPATAKERRSADIVPWPARSQDVEPANLLDRIPIGLAVFRDAVPLFANRWLLAGFDGRALPDLVAAGAFGPVLAAQERSVASGRPEPLNLPGPDGRPQLFLVSGAPVPWGELPARLVSLVPSRIPAEAEAAAPAPDGWAALDAVADAALVLDGSGRAGWASGGAEALFGAKPGGLDGRDLTALLLPADHRAAFACLDAASRDPDGAAASCEVRARPAGGVVRPLAMRARRIGSEAGGRIAVSLRDRSAEDELGQELREAQGAVERLLADRSQVLARMSHEIRTPITAIVGFAELMLEERFGPVGNERYRGYLRDILGSGSHVVSLVNDLLDLAKVASGQGDLSLRLLDLNAVVQGVVALAAPISARERTIVRTSFPPGLPPVVADERSVRQVALNILTNAIRYTGAGGQVIVSTRSISPDEVMLAIRDTGPGMTTDEIEAALTPFQQVAHTRRTGGTGLGLPLSKALVEANGGAFRMTSARGSGTLVEIRLPRERGGAGSVAAE